MEQSTISLSYQVLVLNMRIARLRYESEALSNPPSRREITFDTPVAVHIIHA